MGEERGNEIEINVGSSRNAYLSEEGVMKLRRGKMVFYKIKVRADSVCC